MPCAMPRGKILEEENARLQDKLQLSSHVATSQHLPRSSPAPNTEVGPREGWDQQESQNLMSDGLGKSWIQPLGWKGLPYGRWQQLW